MGEGFSQGGKKTFTTSSLLLRSFVRGKRAAAEPPRFCAIISIHFEAIVRKVGTSISLLPTSYTVFWLHQISYTFIVTHTRTSRISSLVSFSSFSILLLIFFFVLLLCLLLSLTPSLRPSLTFPPPSLQLPLPPSSATLGTPSAPAPFSSAL